jgi:SPP1 gp7 family putative phage head morphogenesis protein
LRDYLLEAYANGLSTDQIAQGLQDLFAFSPARAQMVARTETIAAAVQGDIQGMKEAGVRSTTYMCADDERTCEDCLSMDGEEFDIGDSTGVIPLHPNCRCTFLSNFGD